MRPRYLIVPLIPLVAVWAYVLATSAGQFYELVEVGAAAADTARPTRAPATLIRAGTEAAAEPAAVPTEMPRVDRAATERVLPPPQRIEISNDYGTPYPYDYDEEPPPERLHPEVTDPAMRRLLEPAWAD